MKKVFLVVLCLLLNAGIVSAGEKAPDSKSGICPKTRMKTDCLKCHTIPSFGLIESSPDEGRAYPTTKMHTHNGVPVFLFEDFSQDTEALQRFLEYAETRGLKRVIIEIFSPGGSLFHAWKCVGMIEVYQGRGFIVETRVYGFAASAGFLLFCAGSDGHRLAAPTAELMWHELQAPGTPGYSSPSDNEDRSRVLRHLQDTGNSWIASKTTLTKPELDALIRKKEFWLTGKQAIKYGFASGEVK